MSLFLLIYKDIYSYKKDLFHTLWPLAATVIFITNYLRDPNHIFSIVIVNNHILLNIIKSLTDEEWQCN